MPLNNVLETCRARCRLRRCDGHRYLQMSQTVIYHKRIVGVYGKNITLLRAKQVRTAEHSIRVQLLFIHSLHKTPKRGVKRIGKIYERDKSRYKQANRRSSGSAHRPVENIEIHTITIRPRATREQSQPQ